MTACRPSTNSPSPLVPPAAPEPAAIPLFCAPSTGGLRVAVRLRPGARRTQFLGTQPAAPTPGWPSARLCLAVTEPPEAGRANQAAIVALAAALAVKPAAIALIAGKTSRDKLLSVAGDAATLAARLFALAR